MPASSRPNGDTIGDDPIRKEPAAGNARVQRQDVERQTREEYEEGQPGKSSERHELGLSMVALLCLQADLAVAVRFVHHGGCGIVLRRRRLRRQRELHELHARLPGGAAVW